MKKLLIRIDDHIYDKMTRIKGKYRLSYQFQVDQAIKGYLREKRIALDVTIKKKI